MPDNGSPSARWYAEVMGWPTAVRGDGAVELVTGVRFDVLDIPLGAGLAVLRRLKGPAETGPVAVAGERMRLLVAAGSAEEVPGLLAWLDWSGIPLDLVTHGRGGHILAPARPAVSPGLGPGLRPGISPGFGPGEAAHRALPVWVRPPEPGCGGELPGLSLSASSAQAPGLTRLVGAVANACHRARLFPLAQACALS